MSRTDFYCMLLLPIFYLKADQNNTKCTPNPDQAQAFPAFGMCFIYVKYMFILYLYIVRIYCVTNQLIIKLYLMATYIDGINGNFRGKVGTVIGSSWKGKPYMKSL